MPGEALRSILNAQKRASRAGKVAELVDEARRINPRDTTSAAWAQIAENAEPGGIAASDPTPVPVTFRQAVSRWYENTPGGFDAAVENSQNALRTHGDVFPHNSPAYGRWSPGDVDSPTPVSVAWGLGPFDSRGLYRMRERDVLMNPVFLDSSPKAPLPTLEHELTHALLDKSREKGDIATANVSDRRFDRTPTGSVTMARNPKLAEQYGTGGPDAYLAEQQLRPLLDHESYIMSRAELDPRIAEVRRRHAFYTGNDVLTPENAEKAWEWWRANREWLEDISSPTEWPSMTRSDFDAYDSLPPESKAIMFRRMTQVPAILAPLGVLSGLTEER